MIRLCSAEGAFPASAVLLFRTRTVCFTSLGSGMALAMAMIGVGGCASSPDVPIDVSTPEISTLQQVEAAVARHAESPGRLVAVAYRDLVDGTEVLIEADESVHAASTMKIAVMVELFRRVDRGTLEFDARTPIHNEFASIVDGSPFSLSPADDSDPELYDRIGDFVTLRELNLRMIRRSSNLATNLLVEMLRAPSIQLTARALGAKTIQILRGVEDAKAYRAGQSNTTTARDLLELLSAIGRGEAASADACLAMVGVLAGQEFDGMIPAGLPPGTVVAHKTGRITGIRHDAAIVYPQNGTPYVLVVLTRGFDDSDEAAEAVIDVTRAVHAARTGGAGQEDSWPPGPL